MISAEVGQAPAALMVCCLCWVPKHMVSGMQLRFLGWVGTMGGSIRASCMLEPRGSFEYVTCVHTDMLPRKISEPHESVSGQALYGRETNLHFLTRFS